MFTGKIPFPTFIIYLFPAFKPIAPPDLNTHVANIGDLVSAFFPYHMLASSTWTDGFPLWNPYLLSGVSFIANPQSALFRSEEHTSELQSLRHLVCRLLLEKKK